MGEEMRKDIKTLLTRFKYSFLDQKTVTGISENRAFIYGAGNVGTAVCKLLSDAGINVAGFFDRNFETIQRCLEIPVYSIDKYDTFIFDKDKDYIILAFIGSSRQHNEMIHTLNSMGYINVILFYSIYRLLILGSLKPAPKGQFSIASETSIDFDSIEDRVLTAAELFTDVTSQQIYFESLNAVLSCDADLFPNIAAKQQYFVDDVPFAKGYLRFLDCGAYDGDTAISLAKNIGQVQAITCFEPDPRNFSKLSANLKKQRIAGEQILFPCGVWHRSEMLRFRSGIMSTCAISEIGDTYIQCVAIDDVIPDFAPTFIKMDVEGAEYEALRGARESIEKSSPDLAISVYHHVDHLWEIPLLIKSCHPDYTFHLRSHGFYGVETIVYAVAS